MGIEILAWQYGIVYDFEPLICLNCGRHRGDGLSRAVATATATAATVGHYPRDGLLQLGAEEVATHDEAHAERTEGGSEPLPLGDAVARCPPSHRRLQLPLRRRQPPGPARRHPPRATHACSRIAAAAAALHHGVVGRSLHVSASASAARRPQRRGPGSSASAAGRPLRLRLSLSGTTPAALGPLPPLSAARSASTLAAHRPPPGELCLRRPLLGELRLCRRSPALPQTPAARGAPPPSPAFDDLYPAAQPLGPTSRRACPSRAAQTTAPPVASRAHVPWWPTAWSPPPSPSAAPARAYRPCRRSAPHRPAVIAVVIASAPPLPR
uniref:Uncharacterized protein n=1 Tax=Oryza sativa subsp. japonica TaxID=39947 RepID=Q7EXZ7_ORYSJ|nr:hypothetical protein [Oryza sativa Japonica Group]BAD10728.1 hypothetical protein [Oryza sativa Japonica Group]